jgi:hypothetical protein
MRRKHPERVFLIIVAALVCGGIFLSLASKAAKNHTLLKIGFGVMLAGGVISCVPLMGAMIYSGYRKICGFFSKRAP